MFELHANSSCPSDPTWVFILWFSGIHMVKVVSSGVVEELFLFVGVTVLDCTVKYIVLKLMNFCSSTYIT